MATEGILVKSVIEVLKLVIPVVGKKVGFTWSLKDVLKKLQETLETIHANIADAEEKQEKNNELQLWLKRLKDVAYDADDVMGEFSYETMRRSQRKSFKYKVRDFVSPSNPLAYRRNLAKKIKEINNRVDKIAKDMEKFHLQTNCNNTIIIAHGETSQQRSRQTASVIIDSEIVGRKDDKNKIVDTLIKATTSSSSSSSVLDANSHSLEKVSIISVVGMGGLGKTTLAQLVYNDELVIRHFDQRIWVCVSTDFDVEKIFVKIMESITMTKFDNVSNFDLLVKKVQEKLQRKKFLLVLDDMWNDNFMQWERLKNPLLVGAQGSKILITTRNMQAADVVKGIIPPYQLEKLQEYECWSIMEKRAFSPGGAQKTPNMTNIGKEIATKCSGLPLAAKFLGSLMHSKNKESDWLSIRETGIWNTREGQSEIRPILKLSYDNLSPHLKQCFSYCSIFPRGWEINRETLIQLWMSEGFLGPSSNIAGNEQSMEDIGEEYFDGLVWSSFLDVVVKNDLDDIITCKMHDLVHDLGRDVVGNRECAIAKISELENISDVRRLGLISDDDSSVTRCSEALSELKKLRTIIVLEPANYNNMKRYKFSSNKKLRVLHFGRAAEGCREISYPDANKLRHLRYFNLFKLNLNGMMHVDHSISKLYNLQTLVLSGCLSVQNILETLGCLKNLRFLDISSSDIKEVPDSVSSLYNLQKLNLSHCKSLTTFPSSFSGLQYLKFLDMSSTPIEELPGSIGNLRNLQTLDVNSCEKLQSIPEYVTGLPNLRIFNFKNCPLLQALPEDFGALTLLRSLDLEDTAIKVLPESCTNLYNLEYVDISRCELPKDVTNWTRLRKFYSETKGRTPKGIGKLVLLRSLTYRVPERNEAGIEELANLNFLEDLFIIGLQKVHDPIDAERANLKGKQNLRVLQLFWDVIKEELGMSWWDQKSRNFQVIEALQPPTSLGALYISNFMGSDLPTWMCAPCLLGLELLWLENCIRMKQLPASIIGQLPRLRRLYLKEMSLKSLNIGEFPSLVDLSLTYMPLLEELGCYPYLQDLTVSGCKSLAGIPSFPSLTKLTLKDKINQKLVCSAGRSLTSLVALFLENVDGLVYFPVSILQNNSNLQDLIIKGCSQFEGFFIHLDDWPENLIALCQPEIYSSSLQKLVLTDCPILKFLPDLRGWISLHELAIFNCPQVKESLTYDLKSLSFLKKLYVDFIERDEHPEDPCGPDDLVNLMNK